MRHGIAAFAFVLISGLLLSGDLSAGNLEPPGPPAPTMKTIQQVEPRIPISSIPVTIAAPGSYYLTGDMIGTSGQFGISITASFVTLDLNGFSLIGVGGSFEGIRAFVAGSEHVVIKNGVIRNWGTGGISASNTSEFHVENIRVDNNGGDGVRLGVRSIVRGTTATQNTGSGIVADQASLISGCTAGLNSLGGVVGGTNSVISNTTAFNNNNSGISMGSGTVVDSTAQGSNVGFSLGTGSRVFHSIARSNIIGMSGGDGVSIEECTVELNTDDGIRVAGRGIVRGNIARSNTNDGIHAVGAENRIEENESTGNGVGIRVDGGGNNLVVRNSAGSNTFEYAIAAGNKAGAVTADPTTANSWANLDL